MWWKTQGYFRQGRPGYLICQENLKSKIKWTDFELVNKRVGCIIIHAQFYNNTGFGERQGTICLCENIGCIDQSEGAAGVIDGFV